MIFNIHLLSPLTLKALGLIQPLLSIHTTSPTGNCKEGLILIVIVIAGPWIVGLGCFN